MKTLFAMIAAAAFAAAPAGAAEDDVTIIADPERPSAVILHGDLDLNSAAGTKALKRRIVQAARQLCLSSYRQPVDVMIEEKACYSAAKEDGLQQLEQLKLASAGMDGVVAASGSITIRSR